MQHGQFVIARQRSDLLDGEPIRWSINQPAPRHHCRRLREPGGIPKRANLAPRLVARAGAAIKAFVARRIEKESMLHSRMVLSRCPLMSGLNRTLSVYPSFTQETEIVSDSDLASKGNPYTVSLLECLRQLTGGSQQIQFRLLVGVFRIEKRQPFLVFIELACFQITNAGAALLKLGLQHLQILLCQFELQASYFSIHVHFPGLAGLVTNVERDLGSLVLYLHLRSRQIGLRERDGCACVRR